MTVAVCYKCGAFKNGAWTSCSNCGKMPETDDDIAVSFAMTDHHFDTDTLKQMAADIQKTGTPPNLLPEQKADILAKVERMGILSQLKKDAVAANKGGTGCLLIVLLAVGAVPAAWVTWHYLCH